VWAAAATTTAGTVAFLVGDVTAGDGRTITLQTESDSGNGYCLTDVAVGVGAGTFQGSNTDGGDFASSAACSAAADW
jgi:hypothetical protein